MLPDGTYLQPVAQPKADDLQPLTDKRGANTRYSTSYTVWFDLLGPDGSPRIKPGDDEVTLILSLPGKEKRAKFRLAEWSARSLPRE